MTLKPAYLMDSAGNNAAHGEIAMIKVVVPRAALRVIDARSRPRTEPAVGEDCGLPSAWAQARTVRLADRPDEVHREAIARLELGQDRGQG